MAQVAHAKSSSFIALLDREGHVLDVNPAALIAGGIDRSEVIGLPLWATPWWAERDHRAPSATLERSIAGAAEGRFARFDVDVQIEGAGRATGTLDLLLRPLRGRDGQVAFIVAEGRPITDRKRVEQRLARQNAELSALTQRLARVHDYRERLLGELSHDLRAPLQVVITRSEQVLRGAPDETLRVQLVNIRLAALSALEQINDMLEQVKADHGEAQLTLVDADLAQADPDRRRAVRAARRRPRDRARDRRPRRRLGALRRRARQPDRLQPAGQRDPPRAGRRARRAAR